MKKFIKKYIYNEDAATAIEYGMITAGISIAILAVIFLIGTDIQAMFTFISGVL